MKLIAHRGNLQGPQPEKENHPDHISSALSAQFEVEIDVWYFDDKWFLGHDEAQYEIKKSFLNNDRFWCHAKNIEALHEMLKEKIHCFWHQEDDITLTSKGYIWTYPGKKLTEKSICVLPEKNNEQPKKVLGICSDYIANYRNGEIV